MRVLSLRDFALTVKLGFKKRQLIYSIVIISGIIYPFVSNSTMHYGIFLITCLSATVGFSIFVIRFKDQLRNLLVRERKTPHTVPKVLEYAKEIGIKKDIKVFVTNKKGLANTNIFSRTIRVNKDFYEKLTSEELIFVLGHEIGHLTKKLTLMQKVSMIPCFALIVFVYLTGTVSDFTIFPAIATLILTSNLITRWEEFRADEIGSYLVTKEVAISALKKTYEKKGLEHSSDTHPSGNERIENLERFYANPMLH